MKKGLLFLDITAKNVTSIAQKMMLGQNSAKKT
jgi:hypothetical protein